MSDSYTLISVLGVSPAVLTETVFALREKTDRTPSAVHVITTRVGEAFVRARLQGEALDNPLSGLPFEDAEDRWTPFCRDILDRENALAIHYHVPEDDNGQPLSDVRNDTQDKQFGNLCYTLVERLTRSGQRALVGSMAGGRKTMSAHLMTAFSLYGRRKDHLTHVLLDNPELEDPRNGFYYPVPGSPNYLSHKNDLDLVEIPFLPIRAVVQDNVLAEMPRDERDPEALRKVLEPYAISRDDVERVTLELRDQEARLVFEGLGETLDVATLSPSQTATLLVFAELRRQVEGPLQKGHFYDNSVAYDDDPPGRIDDQRKAVATCCGRIVDPGDWTTWDPEKNHHSKAMSELKNRLAETPIAERMFVIDGSNTRPPLYDWVGVAPDFEVTALYPPSDDDWPFNNIPTPGAA